MNRNPIVLLVSAVVPLISLTACQTAHRAAAKPGNNLRRTSLTSEVRALSKPSREIPDGVSIDELVKDVIPMRADKVALTNPKTSWVGNLVRLDSSGYTKLSTDSPFLTNPKCGAAVEVDSAENALRTRTVTGKSAAKLNLIIASVNLSKENAVSYSISRVGNVQPKEGLNATAIKSAQARYKGAADEDKYFVCVDQELFRVNYRKYKKKSGLGSGSYSGIIVEGEQFIETEDKGNGSFFNLGLIPLKDVYIQ